MQMSPLSSPENKSLIRVPWTYPLVMVVSDKMSPHRKDIIFKREEFSSGGKASQREMI